MTNLAVSLIRTWVPILVGSLLTWLATSLHIVVTPSSQAGLVALCVALLTAGYYALARFLEAKIPAAGVLLGHIAKPEYVTPPPNVTEQKAA